MEINRIRKPVWLSLQGKELTVLAWRKKSEPYQEK